MRADAKSLLDLLGKQDFKYREFADRFSDIEFWPIFDVLLKDTRLFTHTAGTESSNQFGAAAGQSSDTQPHKLSPLFGQYDNDAPVQKASSERDVRTMLRHLSEPRSKGDI